MKRVFLPFLVLILMSPALAQDIKIYGGGDWSHYETTLPQYTLPEYSSSFRGDRHIIVGAGFEAPLFSMIKLDIGLQYFRAGSTVNVLNLGEPYYDLIYELSAVSLPVCFKVRPFRGISPYALAGGALSLIVGHDLTYHFRGVQVPEKPFVIRENVLDDTKRWDVGLILGAGLEAPFVDRFRAFAEVRYTPGLLNLAKGEIELLGLGPYGRELRLRAWALVVGLKLRLGS